ERAVEYFASRTDKRSSLHVFLVTRLLADKHHRCAYRSFTEDSLSCFLIERAALAIHRVPAQLGKRVRMWFGSIRFEQFGLFSRDQTAPRAHASCSDLRYSQTQFLPPSSQSGADAWNTRLASHAIHFHR